MKTRRRDLLGNLVPVLCVKGSGSDLAEVEPAGLPAVRLQPLQELRTLERLSDQDMQNAVRGLGLGPDSSSTPAAAEHQHGVTAPADRQAAQPMGPFRVTNLAFPCDSVASPYQPSCWAYQPLAIVQLVQADIEKTLRACDLAPAPAARARCFAGIGKQSTGWFFEDSRLVIDLCSRAGGGNVDSCLGGAVETLIDSNWRPDAALAFCRQVPVSAKSRCYGMIGERMRLVRAAEEGVRADCQRAEANFVEACLEGCRRTHD